MHILVQVCWALVTVRWSDPCLTLRALHGRATGAIWFAGYCVHAFSAVRHCPFRKAQRLGGTVHPNLLYHIRSPTVEGKHRLLTRAPPPREVAARISRRPFYTHTHRTRALDGGRVALHHPHPRKEKALLPAAMARGESGRSPIGAGAGAATGTGSPGSCATISATAPSGTWLSEGEGEAWGEGAGASEGEGQLS